MSHRCPRRDEGFRPDRNKDVAPDQYGNHGLVNSFAPGCSYCGSISGDDFMDYVRAGGHVGGSDKNYKVYLEKDSGRVHESITRRTGNGGTITQPVQGTGIMAAKFYYQHLTADQQDEFIALLNAGEVQHSLYRTPYFARVIRPEGA